MNLNWNLDKLFLSFESKEFTNALSECITISESFNSNIEILLKSNKSESKKIESYLKTLTQLKEIFSPVGVFASLSFSTDSSNNNALKTIQTLQTLETKTISGVVLFEKWISSLTNIDDIINSSEFLKEHNFQIKQIIIRSKYLLDNNIEEIISELRTTGSKAWDTLQKKTVSNITADIIIDNNTVTMPLQSIRNLAFENDSEKRKLGYYTEMKAYKEHEVASAAALNGIKGESLTISKLRGYNSPLEQTLLKSKMDQETLDVMISAIKDFIPKFRLYYRKKAELLGHDNGLPFYDKFAPIGNTDMTYSYDEAKTFILDQFKTYSNELHDFAKNAFDNNWIDVKPKKGKAGGAFCAQVTSLKESRILTNFTGKLNNVITLAHELGHGFHNYNLFNESLLNIGSPMPLAETASIFCETIVKNAALEKADEKSAISILEIAIQGYSQVIIDIYSRFLFESSLFESRKNGALSVEQIKELMINAQKESYGDGLDPNTLHPYMWMNKVHYYIPDMDFYNFPYSFGLLFAKGLYAKYKIMGTPFIEKLNSLLSSTNKMNIVDCAKILDIDVHSKDFWTSSLNEISNDIDKFINLTK